MSVEFIYNRSHYLATRELVQQENGSMWFEVPGFDRYLISNYGVVFNRHRDRLSRTWLVRGQVRTQIYQDGRSLNFYVARMVVEVWGRHHLLRTDRVLYRDGNPENLHIRNLEVFTYSPDRGPVSDRRKVVSVFR